jgi:hypothetical protein
VNEKAPEFDNIPEDDPEAAALAREEVPNTLAYEDFVAFMPTHQYIWKPTREFWPAKSVNARLKPKMKGVSPSNWLDRHSPVTQMSWLPGEPEIVAGEVIERGGRRHRPDGIIFNSYKPRVRRLRLSPSTETLPYGRVIGRRFIPQTGNTPWVAFKTQHPDEKINHALVVGGVPGVGKDTLLAPIVEAVGQWNFADVNPNRILDGTFNEYRQSVIIRISEAKDLGEFDRYNFYEATKTLIASPPEVLEINGKYIRQYWIPNVPGVIITTNHKTALYLTMDDRRHYVIWSERKKDR